MAHPLYFVECSYGRGNAFRETDRDDNSRDAIIALIASGEIDPIKVIEVYEPSDEYPRGQVLDVTQDIISAASCLFWDKFEPEAPIESRQAALWDHQRDLRKNWEPV